MSVDLALYLLKSNATELDEVLPEEKQGVGGFEKVPLKEGFASHDMLSCWIKKNDPKPTDWCSWLEPGFEFGDRRPETQSSGCVVLLKSGERIFAACFGTGWHAVPDEIIEHDFGLTVALNEVNPKQLRTLVTKTIDIRTRQRDTHQLVGADVPEFALDLDVEWLRSAEGRTERSDCNIVAGSEALHLRGWRRDLEELPHACGEFLTIFDRGVPEAFGFADSVKPIPEDDPLHQRLEGDLQAAMQLRYFEVLSIGLDAKVAHAAKRCQLNYGREQWEVPGLDDDSLRKGLDQLSKLESNFDSSKTFLKLFDADDNMIFNKRLDQLLQMEIDRGGDSYVRIEQRWFRCREDYVARVNKRVAEIDDLSDSLQLPPWDKTIHGREEEYVEDVSKAKDWLLQDQQFYWRGGERIEPCDLLTREKHFIHLKEGMSSSALSHLFGQASGSADLLHRHQPFVTEMKRRYEEKWAGVVFEKAGRPKIVLAIARPPGTELFGKMLLSRINVLEHARRIQSRGFDFAVSRVDLIQQAGGDACT